MTVRAVCKPWARRVAPQPWENIHDHAPVWCAEAMWLLRLKASTPSGRLREGGRVILIAGHGNVALPSSEPPVPLE